MKLSDHGALALQKEYHYTKKELFSAEQLLELKKSEYDLQEKTVKYLQTAMQDLKNDAEDFGVTLE